MVNKSSDSSEGLAKQEVQRKIFLVITENDERISCVTLIDNDGKYRLIKEGFKTIDKALEEKITKEVLQNFYKRASEAESNDDIMEANETIPKEVFQKLKEELE
jgi:hypothetical protein